MNDEFWNEGNLMALGYREIVRRHETDMAALVAERDALQSRNDNQKQQLMDLDRQISPLMSEVSALRDERDALIARVADLESDFSNQVLENAQCADLWKQAERDLRAEIKQLKLENGNLPEIRAKFEKDFAAVLARAEKAEAELEAVKAERDRFHAESNDLHNLKCALEDELAARQSVPVKVRFDVTTSEFNRYFSERDRGLFDPEVIPLICDYLAAHAVIDVPPGVPSVEELTLIGVNAFRSAYRDTTYEKHEDLSPSNVYGNRAQATAIRDAVIAGLAAEKKSVHTVYDEEKINCHGCGATLPKSALEHGYNPIIDGVRVALCHRCWDAGVGLASYAAAHGHPVDLRTKADKPIGELRWTNDRAEFVPAPGMRVDLWMDGKRLVPEVGPAETLEQLAEIGYNVQPFRGDDGKAVPWAEFPGRARVLARTAAILRAARPVLDVTPAHYTVPGNCSTVSLNKNDIEYLNSRIRYTVDVPTCPRCEQYERQINCIMAVCDPPPAVYMKRNES